MAKTPVRIVRRRGPTKRVSPDKIPVRSRQGVDEIQAMSIMPDEADDAAMDAAADEMFVREYGEEELKKRKALLAQYQAIWAAGGTRKK